MFPAFIGGAIGGAIGAAIWAAVAYFFQYEIGWIAWGIGVLVGFGVAVGTRGEGSPAAGVLAAALAVLSVGAGKYVAIQLFMPDVDAIMAEALANTESDEFMKSALAFDLITEMEESGETVAWPEGIEPAMAEDAEDFPPEIWMAAAASWDGMTDEERGDYRETMEANFLSGAEFLRAQIAQASFLESFGAMDLLFMGLAVVTAFRIAARPREDASLTADAPAEAAAAPGA